jgi:hypothetical protein
MKMLVTTVQVEVVGFQHSMGTLPNMAMMGHTKRQGVGSSY